MYYVIEYDENGPFMRHHLPGDYTWAEACERLKVAKREWAKASKKASRSNHA